MLGNKLELGFTYMSSTVSMGNTMGPGLGHY